MAERFLNHQVKVTGFSPKPSQSSTFGAYISDEAPAIEVEDLRVQFTVEKNLSSEPNTCEITITNLATHTRTFFQQKPFHVVLEAGYVDSPLRHLFRGDVRWGQSQLIEGDWETMLQLGDGDRMFRHARVSRSFKGGVSLRDALREVSKVMGVELPRSNSLDSAMNNQYASGLALAGAASSALTELLSPYGFEWSIQSGKLVILRPDEIQAGRATVINENGGMIGSPQFGPPEKPSAKRTRKPRKDGRNPDLPTVTVRMLLFPELSPGTQIELQSKAISGTFKATRVTHSGDTHGQEWVTEVEATPL